MTPTQFHQITGHYSQLSIAVLGDFCLDRYLEIDPDREEISIETGLERIQCRAGAGPTWRGGHRAQ